MQVQIIGPAGPVSTEELKERTFKTGSRGFLGSFKATMPDGKRYQLQVQAVEIGSKPAAARKAA